MKMVWTGLLVLGLVGLGWVMIGKEGVSEEVRQESPRRDRERGMAGEVEEIPEIKIEEVARDLVIPWELVELGDGSLLVTQRPGTLVRIDPEQKREVEVAGVVHVGEGGLQGMAMHPNYEENNWLYLYLTTESDSGLVNRVERYKYSEAENRLEGRVTILDGIPGARVHDGGENGIWAGWKAVCDNGRCRERGMGARHKFIGRENTEVKR